MLVENSPDFKTVWQLAHDWIGADPDKTDPNAISPELRTAIHRLMHAMSGREISARWKGWRIFIDDSFISSVFDFFHYLRVTTRPQKYFKKHLTGFWTREIQFRTSQPNLCDNHLRSIAKLMTVRFCSFV